jgi:hypothetical protein
MDYDFKVGDKVYHDLAYGNFEISEVIGITGKGYIKVQWGSKSWLTFYADGSQRGGYKWSRHRIRPATPKDFEKLQRIKLAEILKNVSWINFSLSSLNKIHEIVTLEKEG